MKMGVGGSLASQSSSVARFWGSVRDIASNTGVEHDCRRNHSLALPLTSTYIYLKHIHVHT